ncbi:MAG TPA: DMT family transporter [Polyangiaceae bacterium]|nr:DMT family transporter [Polyangiaceae bacterium]
MLTFIALCLVARFSYSLNDIFIGRLARRHGQVEVAAFRGLSLGVSMAPWLLLVPGEAWRALGAHAGKLLVTVVLTGIANILQLRAVRFVTFGLRAALMICSMAIGSVLLGWGALGEQLSLAQIGLCVVLVGSGAAVALGSHASSDVAIDVRRGAALTVAAGTLMACAIFGVRSLALATHPLLAAWAWEFGAGVVLLAPLLLQRQDAGDASTLQRFASVGAAAFPTAIASGASVLALQFGELGLWGALGGTQILFTAALGALWHGERLGLWRWVCMSVAAAAVAGLAMLGR